MKIRIQTILFILLLMAELTSQAQLIQQPVKLTLSVGNIDVVPNVNSWVDSFNAQEKDQYALVLLSFTRIPTNEDRNILSLAGISLMEYIPRNTFTAILHKGVNKQLLSHTPLVSIINYESTWKVSKSGYKADGNSSIDLRVTFYNKLTYKEIQAFINSIGGETLPSSFEAYSIYHVRLENTAVQRLAHWYGVLSVDLVKPMVPLDLQSRPAVLGNIPVSPVTNGGYGLMGDSVTVGVGDNASGAYHADLKDRVINFNPVGPGVHGTHVTGIIGASGTVDPLGEGMAPGVKMINYLYDQVLAATGTMYNDYHMTVTNNSYAVLLGDCDYAGTYDGYSRFLDSLSLQYPEVLHVFASGNDGEMTCSPYLPGFATVAGGYGPAKNDILVGSMTDNFIQSPGESRGPTKDGRLKPEIVAVGLGAYSTIREDEYEWAAGTSMASPQVVGGIAALTQQYKRRKGSQPSAQLMKAITLAGATDHGNPGPDFAYGFGRLNVRRSLKIIDADHYYSRRLSNSDSDVTAITVPSNTGVLKVLLTWHDQPASVLAAQQLVNDLDLTVKTPSGTVHYPLVPDSRPGNVNNNAVEQPDHVNNTEEVVIYNPAAGSYQFTVAGHSIPIGDQAFSIAYDIIPNGMTLTYPLGGEGIQATDSFNVYDSVRVFWDAVSDGNSFKVEITYNNGASWQILGDSLSPDHRYVSFRPDRINSGDCRVRLSRNGTSESITSGRFAINLLPVVELDAHQCPGYVNIHWKKVDNASHYQLLTKKGPYLQLVGITADTNYSFSDMSLTEKSYVSVQPILNGINGYRSKSTIVTANTGDCQNLVSNGDLMVETVVSPKSGRAGTTTQLGTSEILSIKLRNLYSAPASSYQVWYNINGGAWASYSSTTALPANDTLVVNIPGLDLHDTITYHIIAAVHNTSIPDPVAANDTIRFTIKQVSNTPITLPYFDGFELMDSLAIAKDSVGISPDHHWDFSHSSSKGRLRSFVNDDITIGGRRSISLDDYLVSDGSLNRLNGTFNLSNYDTANTEIRLDFDYVVHGLPKTSAGNLVTARANDITGWVPLFTYNLAAYPGTVNKAKSLSLTDITRQIGLNFSNTFQLSFGQNDTSLIAARSYGNGITIDNVKLYTVANDAALTSIQSPLPYNCGITTPQPLIVEVKNGVNYTLYNVKLSYSLDSGTINTGVIDSIPAKTSINYAFTQLLNLPLGTSHSVNVWLEAPGDTYLPNDSVLHFKIRNNQVITAFPYLENFESGNGGYYADGINSTWQYGTPSSLKINKAASGAKAWKTNLSGKYNNLEQSYLYSPCYDISSLTTPMLSFSAALDIEDCGNTLCDKAFVEYSYNGTYWRKLGRSGEGTNWYDSTFQAWTKNGYTRWHVASIPIPVSVGSQVISFRFGLNADPGASFEGFAVDDIHIYNKPGFIATPAAPISASATVSGNQWIDFLDGERIVASLNARNQILDSAKATVYSPDTFVNAGKGQYMLPRSFTLKFESMPINSFGTRFYITDDEVVRVIKDTNCHTCNPVTDAYSLGVTQFSNVANPSIENQSLSDDSGGVFTFTPANRVKWVPFDKGYYAEINTVKGGEFWFNNGGPAGNVAVNTDPLQFVAFKNGSNAHVFWRSFIDTLVDSYHVERSVDSVNFLSVHDTEGMHGTPTYYSFSEFTSIFSSNIVYYRLKYNIRGQKEPSYSPIRVLHLDGADNGIAVAAEMETATTVRINWTADVDPIITRYIVERNLNGSEQNTIATVAAYQVYAKTYAELDQPPNVKQGNLVNYQIKGITITGDTLLAQATVQWGTPNTIVGVYPNPTTDGTLNLQWFAPVGAILNIGLFDITGKRLLETASRATQFRNTTTLQTGYKPHGLYLLRTEINGNVQSFKVIFE